MNDNVLKAKLVLAGKSVPWLAKEMNISATALYKKISGESAMSVNDVNKIKSILNLTDKETWDIFF